MPVLITGETGVGKGLVAQAIHFGGAWASKSLANVLRKLAKYNL
jgi:transcriptional regulator with GAF, ATPase, and Fis domain